MTKLLRPAIATFLVLSLVTGVAYPLLTTGIGRWVFPNQVAGSLIEHDGKLVGSALIGQNFSDVKYFWGRPSATTPNPNNAMSSGGSNLGPLNPALTDAVKARVAALKQADPDNPAPVPVDLVTASASGLDPDISPAAAQFQVGRVARARHLPVDQVSALVASHTEGRQFGVLGEPRVNVLRLNLALDALGAKAAGSGQ
ncbi:potassium-transporting ATPase subunit C [Pandoraea terrae]|uniref:Potassium-transporting ATPase KdpC subunit n=1 Tax=Pandoraea terrae TaxID=1537710 RepID=A0A5E4VYK5_9BURK|nr:potassium-transporting ATPase subunit KdpC [Pandoraea terrae]VVE16639.1 potassium-transporting ATPase subunit C [Pandoraea terrae]